MAPALDWLVDRLKCPWRRCPLVFLPAPSSWPWRSALRRPVAGKRRRPTLGRVSAWRV